MTDPSIDELVGDLLAHHLPPTLVELKVRSYNDCIGKAALAGLWIALPKLPNLQVFQLVKCSAIGVDLVAALLPRTGLHELYLSLRMGNDQERRALVSSRK
ncbi:hypothetical protein AMAG_14709 [Allomyces macrogynus ATCC 38327]|uniref:F-box domain-containing protein n=1 Tax=Allomyces macrogynus (strain ATCC 38327) TaxID=578462 RepID=A0A0L0T704_ALLM3|nr:hypothetical protein AMAG_14709 [Allomyces macrogynus ATCC 38327]|eukprot:KNE70583.1 hypothetical protein AMAG_14709 [Allomyces macrogynus ATCC 38327]